MSVALWLIDAAETLRGMARAYTDDANDVHMLTHGAIIVLLRQNGVHAPPSQAALATALTVSAQELAEAEDSPPPMVTPRSLEWTSPGP